MPPIYVNGELVEESDAVVSVLDHGFVVGDGVFETVLLRDGRLFALRRHLQRLVASAVGLGLAAPDPAVVAVAAAQVVEASRWRSGRLRVTYTSGSGPLGSGRGEDGAALVVALGPLGTHGATSSVLAVASVRNEHGPLAGLKTTSYGENALLLARAAAVGADEAVVGNTTGMLCEGTGSNVFVVLDGELLTPPLSSGCLAGVTRALVLEAGHGRERDVPFAAFAGGRVDEAFLTSTLRGVQPIAVVGERQLDAAPGPFTLEAAADYDALLREVAEP